MTVDFGKLARRYEFDFESKTLGTLHCRALSLALLRDLQELLSDETLDGRSFVRNLIKAAAEHPAYREDSGKLEEGRGTPVTAAEVAQLSRDEIEAFAREFLAHNPSLLETHEGAERKVRTGEKGERVVSATPREIDLPKKEDEHDSDYLVRVIRRYLDEQRRRLEPLTSSVSGLFKRFSLPKATQDLLSENLFLSDRLRGLTGILDTGIARSIEPPRIPDFDIPENPIHETNERLNEFLDQINQLRPLAAESANLIRSMNDSVIRMLGDFGRHTQRTESYTRIVILIAALSLVVTAAVSWLNYTDRHADAVRTERLVEEFTTQIRTFTETQDQKTRGLTEEFAKDRASLLEALRELVPKQAKTGSPTAHEK